MEQKRVVFGLLVVVMSAYVACGGDLPKTEHRSEVISEVRSETGIEMTPEAGIEATPEARSEPGPEVRVEAMQESAAERKDELTPERKDELTPERGVERTPEVRVERGKEVGPERIPEGGSSNPPKSSVFPYGLKYQLHKNSPSVALPPHSSYLMTPIGNTTKNSKVKIPKILLASSFGKTLYFDSGASKGGDGSKAKPYNTLDLIMQEKYPNDCALLLKADSVFYESYLKAGTSKKKVYFGSYGVGMMPIVANVDDFKKPTKFASVSSFGGEDITIDGIHIVGGSTKSYAVLVSIGGRNLTIANSHLESIKVPGGRYTHYIFKGGAENMILYHNEIAFSHDDIWYASSRFTYTIVSNYFHHANMAIYGKSGFKPEDRSTWQGGSGDIIQFEYAGLKGAYIANNFFDKGDSAGKFALIFNGGTGNSNVVVEYNTFISPMKSFGGAVIQWHTLGILRKNLLLNTDPQGGASGLASYKSFAAQITGNHFVGYTQKSAVWNLSFSDLSKDNLTYTSLKEYQKVVAPRDRLGADIF